MSIASILYNIVLSNFIIKNVTNIVNQNVGIFFNQTIYWGKRKREKNRWEYFLPDINSTENIIRSIRIWIIFWYIHTFMKERSSPISKQSFTYNISDDTYGLKYITTNNYDIMQ